MHTSVIRIGNSRGIRIPAALLKACNIQEEVDIDLEDGKLIIKPIHEPRQGWLKAFETLHAAEEDTLYMEEVADVDTEEWTW